MVIIPASIAKDLANRGITPGPKYLGSFGSNGSALFTVGKGYLEDTYLWENLNQVDTSPAWQQFVKDYQVNFPGELPQSNSLAFYDAVYAFKTAVEALGITGDPTKLSSEREKIATFLYNSPELQGFQFTYKYVNGMKIMPHFLLQIKNNAFQLAAKVQ
jgi:ABC-type branched-subunit amino acid transport system substrate-binding protein